MTSRERVKCSAKRIKTDRPAFFLRCTAEVWELLRKHFNVETNLEVMDLMDSDIRWLDLPFIGPKDRSVPILKGEGMDYWGNTYMGATNSFGTYYEIVGHALSNCNTIHDIEKYDWPQLDWWDYKAVPSIIKELKRNGDRAILFLVGGAYEYATYMRGIEKTLFDLALEPELIDLIMRKICDYCYERTMRLLDTANGEVDILASGNDIGGVNGMIMSPDMWREQVKPTTKALVTPFKEMGFITFQHSCGSFSEVIDDFIDMGLDFLDPIQVTAKGMEPEVLYEKFGDKLSFHGAIDEVNLLPNATPEKVYNETRRIISILGRNYGLVVSSSHSIQPDTSIANILAMAEATTSYKYK